MQGWQYRITLTLGVACVALSVAIVTVANINQDVQRQIQVRQQQLNNGILGQQAQQVTSTILQDMAEVAVNNGKIRKLLAKYGYNISSSQQTSSGKAAVETSPEEK